MKNLFMKFQNCNLIFVTDSQTEERMGPKQYAPSTGHFQSFLYVLLILNLEKNPVNQLIKKIWPKSLWACKVDYSISVTWHIVKSGLAFVSTMIMFFIYIM